MLCQDEELIRNIFVSTHAMLFMYAIMPFLNDPLQAGTLTHTADEKTQA